MKKLGVLLFFAFISLLSLKAQDIHFTQYYLSPLTLNPANTGYFNGTARISGIYRSQGVGFLSTQRATYTTPAVNIDAPIILGLSPKHWVGGGVAFYSDKAGSLSLTTTGFHGSLAYHMGLGGKAANKGRGGKTSSRSKGKKAPAVFVPSNTYLSIGVTYGSRNRSFNLDAGKIFEEEFGSSPDTEDRQALQDAKPSTTETGVGLQLSSKVNKFVDYQIGVSAFRLITDRFALVENKNEEQTKITAHAQLNYILNDKWSMHPQLLYRVGGESSQVSVQAILGYRFSEEKDVTLLFGPGYRSGDAGLILLGAKVKNLRVGAAFDMTVSGMNNQEGGNSFGAFELGAQYIIKIYKKPSADPVIFCPRL